jgi:hypothetical protein
MSSVRFDRRLAPRPRGSAWLFVALALAVLASSLQGCTTLNAALNSGTTQSILIQDAVELGTQAIILHQPAATQAALAQQVIAAATAAEGVLQDSPTTVAQLTQQLTQQLARSKLPAATQTLLASVASLAVQQISTKINAGALLSGAQAPLMTILSWIIQGATPYAGGPAAVAWAQSEGATEAFVLNEGRRPSEVVRVVLREPRVVWPLVAP